MERIRILLVHTPFNWRRPLTIISHLIRKVTGNFWNHAAIMVKIENSWFILESDIKGVVLLPYKDWVREQTLQIWIPTENPAALGRMLSKCGNTKYDFLSLFWFQLVYQLTGKFYGFTSERKAAKTFYCYEYIGWVYHMKDWFKIDPDSFIRELPKIGARCLYREIKAKELL